MLVVVDNMNEINDREKAVYFAAIKAAEYHAAAVEECEEYYNGDELDDCRSNPKLGVSSIRVQLATDFFRTKMVEYHIPIDEAIFEAKERGLI